MMKYKNLIIWSLIIVVIDLIGITIFQFTQNYPSDGLTVGFLIIPFIIVVNLLIALTVYLFKHRLQARLILGNTILIPFIYTQLDSIHYRHFRQEHYRTYSFTSRKHNFEIELAKDTTTYYFYDVTNKPTSIDGFLGDYRLSGDSVILIDSTRHPIIVGLKLLGYPTAHDVISLKEIAP